MLIILQALIIITLIFIVYQYFTASEVNIWVFSILFFLLVYYNLIYVKFTMFVIHTSMNIGLSIVLYIILSLNSSVKLNVLTTIKEGLLGWSDIIMIVILCFSFPPLIFIVFQLFSLILSMIIGIYLKSQNKTIPFAAVQALVLMFWLIIVNIIWGHPLNDTWLILRLHQ